MAFTILKGLDKPLRKTYKDGKSGKPSFSFKYDLIKTVDEVALEDIYKSIKKLEEEDLNCIVIHGQPKEEKGFQKTKDNCFKRTESNWLQIDVDNKSKDTKHLTIDERLELALAGLPFLLEGSCAEGRVGMVVQLSNKAGISNDHIAIRIYILLDKSLPIEQIEELLKPIEYADSNVCRMVQPHFVRRPELINTECYINGDTVKYYEGGALDTEKLKNSEWYRNQKRKFDEVRKKDRKRVGKAEHLTGRHNTEHTEQLKAFLLEKAATGELEGDRHYYHWVVLAESIWYSQGSKTIYQFILDTPEVLGKERGEKELQDQLDYIHKQNEERFLSPLLNEDGAYQVQEYDLGDADLEYFWRELEQIDYESVVIVKAPHGSGKTSAIVPVIIDRLQKEGGVLRVLYVCSLRSVVEQACETIGLECYLDKNQKVDTQVIKTADKLGICINSIEKIRTNEPYDIVIIDESESVADVVRGKEGFHNKLIETCKKANTTIMLDADASYLTQSMARAISDKDYKLLLNKKAYIENQTTYLLDNEKDFLGTIAQLVKQGKKVKVNVDFSDKKKYLDELAKTIDELAGQKVAVAFDTKSVKDDYKRNPNKYIPELFEEGIQVIITSPIDTIGWRYSGEPRFDATVSSYTNEIHTAPAIIQRSQRCVGVKEHYLYLDGYAHYDDIGRLEDIYYGEDIWAGNKRSSLFGESFEEMLKTEARIRREIEESNPRLHFYYLWGEEFGGQIVVLPPNEPSYYEAIEPYWRDWKKNAGLAREAQIKAAYQNLEHRQSVIRNFETNNQHIDYKEFAKLYRRLESWKTSEAEVLEIIGLANTDLNEHKYFAYTQPPWLKANEQPKDFYVYLGKVVDSFCKRIKELGNPSTNRLILRTKELDHNQELRAVIENYKNHTPKDRAKWIGASSLPSTVVRNLLNTLDYRIRKKRPRYHEGADLPTIKAYLQEEYLKSNILKRKGLIGKDIAFIEERVIEKLRNGQELSMLEEDYISASDFVLVAERKEFELTKIKQEQRKYMRGIVYIEPSNEPIYEQIES